MAGPALPLRVAEMVEASAGPPEVGLALARMGEHDPELLGRLDQDHPLAGALVAVLGASRSLGRLCQRRPEALDVLAQLGSRSPPDVSSPDALVAWKQLELLRIAARDLVGLDPLEVVAASLASLADDVVAGALTLASGHAIGQSSGAGSPGAGLAVIGMGKLGAAELNYASDIDLMVVVADGSENGLAEMTRTAKVALDVAGRCFRVDLALRPEGRNGPVVRTLASYRAYWERWARPWEFQALLKARAVAGDPEVAQAFEAAAAGAIWSRPFGADQLREVREMKARAEAGLARQGLSDREVKRGKGGIRDVEFSVQLLQLVHGRADPALRRPSTLAALGELAEAGYVAPADAAGLERSYRFLRTVEHRLQLVEEHQVHAVPTEMAARGHLARALGYRDDAAGTALARFDHALRRHQAEARAIHERLFFRPLLEAFAVLPSSGPQGPAGPGGHQQGPAPAMSEAAISQRLAAFGFSDARRTRAALAELTGGLTRSSRLMGQVLALVLGWLSEEPDPDLGLLGLRTLADGAHRRALLMAAFRDSPEAARRLCRLLGTSRPLHELLRREPELISTLGDDSGLVLPSRQELVQQAARMLSWRTTAQRSRGLLQLKQSQLVRIAARDLLGLDDPTATATAFTTLAEALVEAALASLGPPLPMAVIGMGRLGGSELSYASDLDLLVVAGDGDGPADDRAEEAARALLRLLNGATPAERVFPVDPRLRPEGKDGRLARSLEGYRTYYRRWAQVWERQALVRARPVAGSAELGAAFMALADNFVWGSPFTDQDIRDVRRMKARVERERLPPGEDPRFHLKLGPGALVDVEWTAQLLQLSHHVPGTGTVDALAALATNGALDPKEAAALTEAYRCCEQVRNRWALMGGTPTDAMPVPSDQLGRLAHSLGTTPAALRQEYRRVTRRARRVVERRFYGLDHQTATGSAMVVSH